MSHHQSNTHPIARLALGMPATSSALQGNVAQLLSLNNKTRFASIRFCKGQHHSATGVKCCFHNEYALDYAQTQHSLYSLSALKHREQKHITKQLHTFVNKTLKVAPFLLVLCHDILLLLCYSFGGYKTH